MVNSKKTAPALTPPPWLDADVWAAFVEMRRAKGSRAPLTERAQQMILAKLDRLRRDGHDATACLEESVMNGWSGVFPLKAERKPDGTYREPPKPWHETATGIIAKGVELGIGSWSEAAWVRGECPAFPAYRARVYKAAGFTPERA